MSILDVPAVGSTSVGGSHIDKQRLINLYPVETKGKALKSAPGMEWCTEIGSGDHRGAIEYKEKLIYVSGSSVYAMDKDYGVVNIGTVSGTTGRCILFHNGTQVMIIDRTGKGYTWDGGYYAQITDPDFTALKPTTGVFHDGYAVVNKSGTGEFYISTSYDFSEWAALDFATAESYPDDITHIETDKSLLWVFGTKTLEVYQNTGNVDFPFEPLRSVTSHFGAIPETVRRLDNTLFWLAENEQGGRVVVRLVSNADPVVISDEEINAFLGGLAKHDFEAVETDAIWWQGHPWYLITFKEYAGYGITLVYDSATGAWWEWSGRYESVDSLGRVPFSSHVYFNGEHLVGDLDTGDVYRLKGSNMNGAKMVRERRFRAIRANGMPLKFSKVEVEMETGNGTDADTMELSISFDGGRTWGNSRAKSIGAQGQYGKRVIWHRCGQGRNSVIRLRSSADRDLQMTRVLVTATQ